MTSCHLKTKKEVCQDYLNARRRAAGIIYLPPLKTFFFHLSLSISVFIYSFTLCPADAAFFFISSFLPLGTVKFILSYFSFKSPQRGFGGDDSGFHCLCFYFCCFRSVMNKLFCFLGKLNVWAFEKFPCIPVNFGVCDTNQRWHHVTSNSLFPYMLLYIITYMERTLCHFHKEKEYQGSAFILFSNDAF